MQQPNFILEPPISQVLVFQLPQSIKPEIEPYNDHSMMSLLASGTSSLIPTTKYNREWSLQKEERYGRSEIYYIEPKHDITDFPNLLSAWRRVRQYREPLGFLVPLDRPITFFIQMQRLTQSSEEQELLNWDVNIEEPPKGPAIAVKLRFIEGGYRPPRIPDDPRE